MDFSLIDAASQTPANKTSGDQLCRTFVLRTHQELLLEECTVFRYARLCAGETRLQNERQSSDGPIAACRQKMLSMFEQARTSEALSILVAAYSRVGKTLFVQAFTLTDQ
jgi:hypothetical protein